MATGHQPELYHPGVWIKDFLLQRSSEELPATAVDFVVDSDGFQVLGVSSPCMTPGRAALSAVPRRRERRTGGTRALRCPSERDLADFCAAADSMLAIAPGAGGARGTSRRSAPSCEAARPLAGNLAELVTIARRRYEAPAGSDYLELPVTARRAHAWRFARFVVDLALDAERFARAYNAELAEYRAVNKTRSAAQPFPDLAVDDGAVELPLWLLADRRPDVGLGRAACRAA